MRRGVALRQDQGRLLFRFVFGAFGRDRYTFRCALAGQLLDGIAEGQAIEPLDEINSVTADFLVVRIPAAAVDPDLMLLPEILVPFPCQRFSVRFQKRFDVGAFCSKDLLLCVSFHGPPVIVDLPRKSIALPRGVLLLSAVCSGCRSCPLLSGVASLACIACPCGGCGDVVSFIQPVVRFSMSYGGKIPSHSQRDFRFYNPLWTVVNRNLVFHDCSGSPPGQLPEPQGHPPLIHNFTSEMAVTS